MEEKWQVIDVWECGDGSLESILGMDGSSEVYFAPASEETIKRYRAVCDLCGKREWIKLPKQDRCDCDVLIDLRGNTKKVMKGE